MTEERKKVLITLAYILSVNELGMGDMALTEEDITRLLLENEITMEELVFLDELVQGVIEEVKRQQNDE